MAKLVRNYIRPTKITFRQCEKHHERIIMLKRKLLEEAAEVATLTSSYTNVELVTELADVAQVLRDIAEASGIEPEAIETYRTMKESNKGSFSDAMIMEVR